MLTREEWQENLLVCIDGEIEAEMALGDQNELIKLMGEIIYKQHKLIDDVEVIESYLVLQKLMLKLPKDWTETLEV